MTIRLYHVSARSAGGLYVSFVAPAIGAKVVPSRLDCHSYETAPSKVGVTLVNGVGISPSHIVCAVPIEPAVRLLTVTFIEGVASVHVLPFKCRSYLASVP